MSDTDTLAAAFAAADKPAPKAPTPAPAAAPAPTATPAPAEGEGVDDSAEDLAALLVGDEVEGEPGEGDGEHEGGDGDGEPDADAVEDDDDDGPTVEVIVDGEKQQVKLSLLVREYQKGQTGAKRLNEAALFHKAVVEREQAVVAREAEAEPYVAKFKNSSAQLETALKLYDGIIRDQLFGTEPDRALINTDLPEYMRQKAAYDDRLGQLAQLRENQQRLAADIQAQQEDQRQREEATERAKVLDAIPAWRDASRRNPDLNAITKMLGAYGFTAPELERVVDSRQLQFLHTALRNAEKAKAFDDLVAKGKIAAKRVQAAPPIPEKAGARRTASDSATIDRKKADNRFKSAPTVDNLAAYWK